MSLSRVLAAGIVVLLADWAGGQTVTRASAGGGGYGEPVVRGGRWTFDILSEAQRLLPDPCQNTALRPAGDVVVDFAWQPSSDSTVPPRVDFVGPTWYPQASLDVFKGALVFNEPGFGGFLPGQVSLMESPPLFPADLGFGAGPVELAFTANANPVPETLLFVAGVRVMVGGEWTPWEDQEFAILPGPHEYRIPFGPLLDVEAAQVRVGVQNADEAQPVEEETGPAVDEARVEEVAEAAPEDIWKYVPDISQGNGAICQGTAFANCLRYWAESNETYEEALHDDPEASDEEKNEELQDDLVEECHENDEGDLGVVEVLRDAGIYRGQDPEGDTDPLEYVQYFDDAATAENFQTAFQACHDVLLRLMWYNEEGELAHPSYAHYVTVAGMEFDDDGNIERIHVANPWGDSHHSVDEDNRDDAYETLEVTVDEDGRIRVDNNYMETHAAGVNGAAYMCVTDMGVVRPVSDDEDGPGTALATIKSPAEHMDGLVTYEYTVSNDEATGIGYVGLFVDVPVTNIQAPPGWEAQRAPAYYHNGTDCNREFRAPGIIWRTFTDPVLPGETLSGFAFETDEVWPVRPFAATWYTETEGMFSRFGLITGPVPIGDMDCDGDIDFDDINPFVTALSGQDAYEAAFPGCDWLNGDCDGNGQVDFDDINCFVGLLSS